MAVTDTLFIDLLPEGSWVVSEEESVVLETPCPECGTALRVGTPDLCTTGGYFVPLLYCENHCNLRPHAHQAG